MTRQIEAAGRALADTGHAPMVPALGGCRDCGTLRMIASPAPLGACPDCGTDLEVLPLFNAAADRRSALAA